MSEHTKGRLHQCSHSDKRLRDESGAWVAATDTVRRSESECTANSRRLAACWNAFENVSTEMVEATVGTSTMQAACDAMARLPAAQAELAAARALLREVIKQDEDDLVVLQAEFSNRVISYLDACDTLEGRPNAS
jgi:hypothetical protein